MVYVNLAPFDTTGPEVSSALAAEGILTLGFPGTTMRLVTHRDVSAADIQTALGAFKKVLGSN